MTKALRFSKAFIISLAMLAAALFSFLLIPAAQADTFEEVVKGALNLETHKNHKLRSSFNGTFLVDDSYGNWHEKWEGNYQVVTSSQVDNSCGLGCKEAHDITLKSSIHYQETNSQTQETFSFTVNVTMEGSLLAYNANEEIYFKLEGLNFTTENLPEKYKMDLEEVDQIVKMVETSLKGKWFHFNQEALMEEYGLTEDDLAELGSEELETELLAIIENHEDKTGKEVMMELVGSIANYMEEYGEVDPEEKQRVLNMAEGLMNTKMGYRYSLVNGYNKGFERWIFNPYLFTKGLDDLLQKFAGGKLSDFEKSQIMEALQKMSFSMWYRLNEEGLMDIFSAYFQVSDDSDESHQYFFNLRFRQQLWGEGEARIPNQPTETSNLEELMGVFEGM